MYKYFACNKTRNQMELPSTPTIFKPILARLLDSLN